MRKGRGKYEEKGHFREEDASYQKEGCGEQEEKGGISRGGRKDPGERGEGEKDLEKAFEGAGKRLITRKGKKSEEGKKALFKKGGEKAAAPWESCEEEGRVQEREEKRRGGRGRI